MKLVNCSKYSDGQGAFKNGMHDCITKIKLKDNLYRQGLPWQRVNRFVWCCGWLFQRATGIGYYEDSNAIRMARKFKDVLNAMVTAIRCADEEHFRRAWDDACTYLHLQDLPPRLIDALLNSRNDWRENAKCELKMRHEALARAEVLAKRCRNQRRELSTLHRAHDLAFRALCDRIQEMRNNYKIVRHAADEASRQRDEQATLIAQLRAELNSARATINTQGATIEQLEADGPHLSVLQDLVPNLFKPE